MFGRHHGIGTKDKEREAAARNLPCGMKRWRFQTGSGGAVRLLMKHQRAEAPANFGLHTS